MIKKQRKELVNKMIDFISSDIDPLLDHVSDDLKINVDYELSRIYDDVDERFCDASFEDIVEKTRDRIIIALESFIKYE